VKRWLLEHDRWLLIADNGGRRKIRVLEDRRLHRPPACILDLERDEGQPVLNSNNVSVAAAEDCLLYSQTEKAHGLGTKFPVLFDSLG